MQENMMESYSVEGNAQKEIFTSKDQDNCHVADVPWYETES